MPSLPARLRSRPSLGGGALRLLLGAAIGVGCILGARAQPSSPFASPAINRDLYREGAVRRTTNTYDQWSLVCDEIAALRQRHCSLFHGRGRLDGDFVQMVVSTSDDGKPAAILRVPLGILLDKRIRLSVAGPEPIRQFSPAPEEKRRTKKQAKPPRPENNPNSRELLVVSCDQAGCFTLLPMTTDEIGALMGGRKLQVRYFRPSAVETATGRFAGRDGVPVMLEIEGEGFPQAIAASQAP